MKRKLFVSLILPLMFSGLAGGLFVSPAVAENPEYALPGHITISVQSPPDITENPVNLTFIIQNTYGPPTSQSRNYFYTLDKLTISDRATLMFGDEWKEETVFIGPSGPGTVLTEPRTDLQEVDLKLIETVEVPCSEFYKTGYGDTYLIYFVRGTAILPFLSDGRHHLTVYYGPSLEKNLVNPGIVYQALCTVNFQIGESGPDQNLDVETAEILPKDEFPASSNSPIHSKPTKVSILLPKNQTYDYASIPLNFIIYGESYAVSYSLDDKGNITVSENSLNQHFLNEKLLYLKGSITLSDLSVGTHSLMVYAEDEVGHVGTSETLYFTIEKDLTVNEEQNIFPTSLVIAIVVLISVIAVSFGLVLHFVKRSRKRSRSEEY